MPSSETTPTRPTGDEVDPAGTASAIVTTLSVMMDMVHERLAEVAVNPEAFGHLGAALDRVAEIAAYVEDADRWLTTGQGPSLAAITREIAQQAAHLDRVRVDAWALADRRDADRPVLTLVAGGAS